MIEIKDETFFLVASDVHDSEQALEKLGTLAMAKGCRGLLYAGDLNLENWFIRQLVDNRGYVFLPVLGNCDNQWTYLEVNMNVPMFRTLEHEGFRIFLTHGHLYWSPAAAGYQDSDFDIIITGHTHMNGITKEEIDGKPVLFLNPGSPSRPRGGSKPSYAVLRFTGDGSAVAEIRSLDSDSLLSQETISVKKSPVRDN